MGGAWEHTFMVTDALFVYTDTDVISVGWPLAALPDVWFLGRGRMGSNADYYTIDALREMFLAGPIVEVPADRPAECLRRVAVDIDACPWLLEFVGPMADKGVPGNEMERGRFDGRDALVDVDASQVELEEVVRLMTTVLECLPSEPTTARDEPIRDAPIAAQQVRGRKEDVNEPPSADGSVARERVPQPHTTIHIGNLRANGRTAPWRPENTEDRRVDRGTPLGNPFPIDPSDDHEREAACTAYAELIRSELTHANVQEIAARHELRVDQRYALPTATQALRHALHRLERDVMELQPGRSIRLMCHCTPKQCHAHVIEHGSGQQLGITLWHGHTIVLADVDLDASRFPVLGTAVLA
jgi:hypothetical protein